MDTVFQKYIESWILSRSSWPCPKQQGSAMLQNGLKIYFCKQRITFFYSFS